MSKEQKADRPILSKNDLNDLEEVFRLARGNSISINNESTMSNIINYKQDLFKRIEQAIEILEAT